MSEPVPSAKFERAFHRLVRKNPALQPQIETTLRRMAENLNDPRLKTHHLSRQLAGLHACSAGYDCRIVFRNRNIQNPARRFCSWSTSARTRKFIEITRTGSFTLYGDPAIVNL